MAELLVRAQDAPVADGPGKWKQGQVVVVKDDGHSWGAAERLPKFVVVIVPNIDAEDVTDFLKEHRDEFGELLARRSFFFDRTKLTVAQRNELQTNGTITLTRVQIKAIKQAVT